VVYFLAIGIAGVWALAAKFAKIKKPKIKRLYYPMVSFIVPATTKRGAYPAASKVCLNALKNMVAYAKSSL
jgi:hypothetical protein